MNFKPIAIGLITFVCLLIIVVSLSQVAARSCTLAQSTNDADRHFAVCVVRVP